MAVCKSMSNFMYPAISFYHYLNVVQIVFNIFYLEFRSSFCVVNYVHNLLLKVN